MARRSQDTRYLKVEGSLLKLTHLEKIFYPKVGFKKKDLLRYYEKIAPVVLPHLCDRPFTFLRFPNGVSESSFYQKQCPENRPTFIKTGVLHATTHCLINTKASLLWAVNLGAVELHTTLGKLPDLESPTSLALDLDPGEGADLQLCAELALEIKKLLQPDRLELFPKTSGKKGLHLFIPLNSACSFEETQSFAKWIAQEMERIHGDWVISKMTKKLRTGKVFIDWSQNKDFKTTSTVYSLRANTLPTVSTPLHWQEVHDISKKQSESRRFAQMVQDEILARVNKRGDLFAPVLKIRQSLPHIRSQFRKAA